LRTFLLATVSVGKLDAGVLTMSVFSAEDHPGLGFRPGYWLRKLRPDLGKSKVLRYGVKGVNIVYGGEGAYDRIGYTERAFALHGAGVKWKQFITGNVEFHPLAAEGAEHPPS
jgi:hypothetical protein